MKTDPKEFTINGLTFFQFSKHFEGKIILNKQDKEVPKFILYWQRKSIARIKETHTLIDRV